MEKYRIKKECRNLGIVFDKTKEAEDYQINKEKMRLFIKESIVRYNLKDEEELLNYALKNTQHLYSILDKEKISTIVDNGQIILFYRLLKTAKEQVNLTAQTPRSYERSFFIESVKTTV